MEIFGGHFSAHYSSPWCSYSMTDSHNDWHLPYLRLGLLWGLIYPPGSPEASGHLLWSLPESHPSLASSAFLFFVPQFFISFSRENILKELFAQKFLPWSLLLRNPTHDKSPVCARKHIRHWNKIIVAGQETYKITTIIILKVSTIHWTLIICLTLGLVLSWLILVNLHKCIWYMLLLSSNYMEAPSSQRPCLSIAVYIVPSI